MDSVEMEHCSQIDTEKAAIRFENARTHNHVVKDCSFHNGFGWGGAVKRSWNVKLENNLWFNFRPIGVGFNEVKDI